MPNMLRLPKLALLATFALTIIAYMSGLHGPLVFDDGPNLEPINDWLHGHVSWVSVVFDNESGVLGRSLSMASFVVNVALLGPNAWGLKAGNLLIHLINGCLVFVLFCRLIKHGVLVANTDRTSMWPAWFGASVWLLHPLLASTVLYVVQRMAMLSALFTLLAMLAYLRGRSALNEGKRPLAYALLALAVPLCTVLATLSKENGILAPALCALLELIVFSPSPGQRRNWLSKAFVGLALIAPALTAIVATLAQFPLVVGGYAGRPFTLTERLLTETRVLWDYVGDLLVPSGSHLGFYHDDFPVSHGLFAPPTTALAIICWIAAITFAWRLRNMIPGLALGLGIFLVGHALESTVFPLMLYFEHRNYLPGIGGVWAILSIVVFCADGVRGRLRHASFVFSIAACILILVLAAGTSVRASVWADSRTMTAEALLTHPNSRSARLDSIREALDSNPPAFDGARADADWLRRSSEPNTKRMGTIERVLVDCLANGTVDAALVREMFEGTPGPFEEELLHVFEQVSDGVASHACAGLSPTQLADGLAEMLDRWEPLPGHGSNWRLRFRAANLYMASDRNADAIQQGRLAYGKGAVPTNTAIMIAGMLLYAGDTAGATQILDKVEPKLRPSDKLAREIVLDDRKKIREAKVEAETK